MTIFSSCIEEFKLPLPVQEESGIVIQGNLFMNAESVIYVNKPQAIGSKRKLESIADAEVYIISQDGTESNKAIYDKENERYIAAATELNPEQSYAVKVIANGETYQSEFLQILQTPEITDLNYKEQEDGVSVHISTEGSNDASRYYMWSYEEDWEFHAELDIAKTKISVMAVVDTLEYLKRGGRISATVAFAGALLSIKPVIAVIDGEVKVIGKAMGRRRGIGLLTQLAQNKSGIDFSRPYGLVSSGDGTLVLDKFKTEGKTLWAENGENISDYPIGSTIGTHVGPGAVGIAFFEK